MTNEGQVAELIPEIRFRSIEDNRLAFALSVRNEGNADATRTLLKLSVSWCLAGQESNWLPVEKLDLQAEKWQQSASESSIVRKERSIEVELSVPLTGRPLFAGGDCVELGALSVEGQRALFRRAERGGSFLRLEWEAGALGVQARCGSFMVCADERVKSTLSCWDRRIWSEPIKGKPGEKVDISAEDLRPANARAGLT